MQRRKPRKVRKAAVKQERKAGWQRLGGKRGGALLAIVSILLLLFLFSQVNIGELSRVIAAADLGWLALALLASLAAGLARVLRWQVLLREKAPACFWKLLPIQLSGIALSNFTPGKAGEPVKVVFLKKLGFRYSFALLSVAWERLFDVVLLSLAALGVVLGIGGGETQGLILLGLAGLGLLTLVLHYRLQALLSWLSGFRFLSFLEGFEAHRFSGLTLLGLALGTILIWSLDFLSVWAAFLSVGVAVDYLFLASAFSAAVLLGIVSFLPGGLGSTEAALLFFLSVTPYPASALLAGVVLARLCTIVFSTALGLLLLPLARR